MAIDRRNLPRIAPGLGVTLHEIAHNYQYTTSVGFSRGAAQGQTGTASADLAPGIGINAYLKVIAAILNAYIVC
jgi:hypothetical protein